MPKPRERLADWAKRMSAPVIAAPMFLVSGPELVLACRAAGAIGAFPFPNARTLDTLDAWLAQCGGNDGPNLAPFAANMVTHSSYDRLADELALLERHRPDIVITALGGPQPVLATVHGYGGLVFADVNSLAYARKAAAAGADGLVLVCAGAGGHTGKMTPFAFVSEVRRFFDGIIVVGGGIATGEAVRAAEVLGADLAYVGTGLIAASESLAPPAYREMLIEARFEDLVASSAFTGAEALYLRQSLLLAGQDPDALPKSRPDFTQSQGSIKAWRDLWSAGHGVGQVTAVRPAADILGEIACAYHAACVSASPFHPQTNLH
jgi:nitronate monooxygenase